METPDSTPTSKPMTIDLESSANSTSFCVILPTPESTIFTLYPSSSIFEREFNIASSEPSEELFTITFRDSVSSPSSLIVKTLP